MRFFESGQLRIPYSVLRGTSRRYTYFRFRPDATLEVVVPRGRTVDVEDAISGRLSWVRREYERMKKASEILAGGALMYGGVMLHVEFEDGGVEGVAPHVGSGKLTVRTADRRRLKELVRRWFLRESSSYVVAKVREMAPSLAVRPSRVDVREIDKWGYCTRTGRISFSWQLIALPERLREYVVLHELAHLLEFNHSAKFRRVLAQRFPDFRQRERELDLILPYDRKTLD